VTSRRELAVVVAIIVLAAALAVAAPGFFAPANLRDLFLANLPVLVVGIGATLVILSGEIDISCGSVFAVCSVMAGVLAKTTGSVTVALAGGCLMGAVLGSLNGVLVAYARIPSIVVTLATMIGLRDGLRWATGGTWVAGLPSSFQWLGLSQRAYPVIAGAIVVALFAAAAGVLGHVVGGRAVYAVGSNAVAARLAGLRVERVKWVVFAVAGALTAVAAVLNAMRFNQIPSNSGLGLEMKVIAAAVVGGAAITGGRGTMRGTLLGVVLLGAVGPALTFFGVTPYWERALQGAIILVAVAAEAWRR
jgi:rhamnose transport system permease protein